MDRRTLWDVDCLLILGFGLVIGFVASLSVSVYRKLSVFSCVCLVPLREELVKQVVLRAGLVPLPFSWIYVT